MWTSLKDIVKPQTVAEALAIGQTAGSRYLAGGTYLVSEQDPSVTTLIDLSGLLKAGIAEKEKTLLLGAGVTLQVLVDSLQKQSGHVLAEAARYSVGSKNIRNQRTLGGEITRMRIDSELGVLLRALRAKLYITGVQGSYVTRVDDWDRNGILTHIEISRQALVHSALERYALLPSAPAFLIVGGVKFDREVSFCAGGRARHYYMNTCHVKEFTEKTILKFSETAAEHFESDRYGTRAYKKRLLQTAFSRLREKL